MIKGTDIQTYASDIKRTAELIEGLLESLFFNNENFKDTKTEKELNDIANQLWVIKTKLEAKEEAQ